MTTAPMSPRTKSITLLQGEDEARLLEIRSEIAGIQERRAQAIHGRVPVSKAGDEREAVLTAEHDALLIEAEPRSVKVILRTLGRRTYRGLIAAHPPREDHAGDRQFDFNLDAGGDSLVQASLASPVFTSDAERDAFLDSLSDWQFEQLLNAALVLNRAGLASPKAISASGTSPSADAI